MNHMYILLTMQDQIGISVSMEGTKYSIMISSEICPLILIYSAEMKVWFASKGN